MSKEECNATETDIEDQLLEKYKTYEEMFQNPANMFLQGAVTQSLNNLHIDGNVFNPRFIEMPGEKRPYKLISAANIEPANISVALKELHSLAANMPAITIPSNTDGDVPLNPEDLGDSHSTSANRPKAKDFSPTVDESMIEDKKVNDVEIHIPNTFDYLLVEHIKFNDAASKLKNIQRYNTYLIREIKDIIVPETKSFSPTVDEPKLEHKKVDDVAPEPNQIQSNNTNVTPDIEDLIKLKDFPSTRAGGPKVKAISPTVDEPMLEHEKVDDVAPESNQTQNNNTNVTRAEEDLKKIKSKDVFDHIEILSEPVWV